jgi:hypothetical protein
VDYFDCGEAWWAILYRSRRSTSASFTSASITGFTNNTTSGWLVGGGIEWAFAPNWSAKIEYDYLGLNNRTFTAPAGTFLAEICLAVRVGRSSVSAALFSDSGAIARGGSVAAC